MTRDEAGFDGGGDLDVGMFETGEGGSKGQRGERYTKKCIGLDVCGGVDEECRGAVGNG